MSEWVATHQPCPACGSSDAYSINDRGWGKCFSCGKNINENAEDKPMEEVAEPTTTGKTQRPLIPHGEFRPLNKRKITEETCRKFGYFIGTLNGSLVQVAPYYDEDGKLCGQKVRGENKKFITTGDFKRVTLFGQQLWKSGGKKLVITEGEIDCLSMSQLQGNKWPTVSLPNGAQSTCKQKNPKHQIWAICWGIQPGMLGVGYFEIGATVTGKKEGEQVAPKESPVLPDWRSALTGVTSERVSKFILRVAAMAPDPVEADIVLLQ